MSEKYTIEIARQRAGGEVETLRTHSATSVLDAEVMVDSLRETYHAREDVSWDGDEVDKYGKLYGTTPTGTVYEISVAPPLRVTA